MRVLNGKVILEFKSGSVPDQRSAIEWKKESRSLIRELSIEARMFSEREILKSCQIDQSELYRITLIAFLTSSPVTLEKSITILPKGYFDKWAVKKRRRRR
jgi:hypothetical protein